MPTVPDGNPITDELEFDVVMLEPVQAHGVGTMRLYDDGTYVGRLFAIYDQNFHPSHVLEHDNPEVMVAVRRVRSGGARVTYGSRYPGVSRDAVSHLQWEALIENPFEPMYGFFENLAHYGSFEAATHRSSRRFRFPGIVEGAERRYYKREDDAETPDLNAVSEFAGAGWTPDIPLGPHELHAIDVLDGPGSVSIGTVQRVYHRRKDATAAIVAIARVWHKFWRLLPANEQALSSRTIVKNHVEHAIGRCWADKPFTGRASVFYKGERTAERRDQRDVEDWMLGNLEQWVDWGFAELVSAIATDGTKRSLLNTELGDYTFCHVERDGTIADKLSNGADGLLQTTWDAYQDTHYAAAVVHGLDSFTVGTLTIDVHQGDTETAHLPVTGGLAPYLFEIAFPPSWASIDAAGEITVEPDNTVAIEDHTLNVKVTDDLGTVQTRAVTVTVLAAE